MKKIIEGDVDLSSLLLTELLDLSDVEVGSVFDCDNNNLTSLEGAPQTVGGSFYCNNNNLTSLEGAPKIVDGRFYCIDNNLTSLKGIPKTIGGNFYIDKSLEGKFPEEYIHSLCKIKGVVKYF